MDKFSLNVAFEGQHWFRVEFPNGEPMSIVKDRAGMIREKLGDAFQYMLQAKTETGRDIQF